MTNETPSQAEKVAIIKENGGRRENILGILLALQDVAAEGYVDQPTIALVAETLGMTETRIYEIASFYSMIKTVPQARHVLQVCDSTPCYFTGGPTLADWLESELGVKAGETTADGMFSIEHVSCVGVCEVGPVIKVRDKVFGNLTEEKTKQLIADLRADKPACIDEPRRESRAAK